MKKITSASTKKQNAPVKTLIKIFFSSFLFVILNFHRCLKYHVAVIRICVCIFIVIMNDQTFLPIRRKSLYSIQRNHQFQHKSILKESLMTLLSIALLKMVVLSAISEKKEWSVSSTWLFLVKNHPDGNTYRKIWNENLKNDSNRSSRFSLFR